MPENNSVTVLVNSCDSYSDIWEYFFFFFNKYWHDCPYPVAVNSETAEYSQKYKAVRCVHPVKKVRQWSGRLLAVLEQIESEYVICMLDDFFLLGNVRQDIIDDCVHRMDEDKDIAYFMFENRFANPLEIKNEFDYFRRRDVSEDYLASAQVVLWRKSFLKKILRKNETPWDFEWFASIRCRHCKEKMYVLNSSEVNVFPLLSKGDYCCGICGGKWAPNTVELFEKHGLECDFNKRGFYDREATYASWTNPKLSLIQKITLPICNRKLFISKVRPKILRVRAKIDFSGRIRNILR